MCDRSWRMVEEEATEEEKEEAAGCRAKNKKPTQRCGEQYQSNIAMQTYVTIKGMSSAAPGI